MSKLEQVIAKLKNLKGVIENGVSAGIIENKEEFEQMQRDRLTNGINADGDPLKRNNASYPAYSNAYAKKRKAKGLQIKHPDLKVTGDFHEGITSQKVGKKKVTMYSKDYKNDFLIKQYDGVFGFSPAQKEQVKALMLPTIERTVKQEIGI
jgi:hypothetical protein